MCPRARSAREACAVGAGALDTEGSHAAERAGPNLKLVIALPADRDGRRAELCPEPIESDGGMSVFVGVDADDDVGRSDGVHG